MAKISVIIPVYNGEKTIVETIQSLQKQTFSDFEMIVINDGSTDGTVEKVSTVQDPRLKIFSYENGGLPVARNRGMSHATGEFISFIDADDLWTPDKLELQLAALEKNPEAGVAYSWCAFMNDKAEYYHADAPIYYDGNVHGKMLLRNFIANGSNILIRKKVIDLVGEFDGTLASCEDWDFYLRLAANCPFVVVQKPQILYRLSSGSMSAKVDVIEKYSFLVLERAFKLAPQELQYLKSHSFAYVYIYSAELGLRHGSNDSTQLKQIGQKFWLAIRTYPKILLVRKTQRLLLKWFLHQVVPSEATKSLMQFIKKVRATPLQKIQP